MFANWWQGELHKRAEEGSRPSSSVRPPSYVDSEVNATIPYIEETTSMASWEELSNLSSPHRIPPMPRPKAKTSDYKIDPDEAHRNVGYGT